MREFGLKRFMMMVGAMLAVIAVAAVPVLAQPLFFGFDDGCFFDVNGNLVCPTQQAVPAGAPGVSQEFSERRITSGAAAPSFSFSNTGDNVNACPTSQQIVNTGNVANEQGVVQYASEADDIDFSGSSINIDGSVSGDCTQTIEQAAASGP